MKTINQIKQELQGSKVRSAWGKGVVYYAGELLDNIGEATAVTEEAMLNGANNWSDYSHGGCSLVCNGDIAQCLCTATEIKETKNGQLAPNARESWLDVQTRALRQACRLVLQIANN